MINFDLKSSRTGYGYEDRRTVYDDYEVKKVLGCRKLPSLSGDLLSKYIITTIVKNRLRPLAACIHPACIQSP